jgi:hypothetical protein
MAATQAFETAKWQFLKSRELIMNKVNPSKNHPFAHSCSAQHSFPLRRLHLRIKGGDK